MLRVAILIGLPGAGKSTFYRRCLARDHRRVSKDDFRNVRRPALRQAALIEETLAAGRSVAVDNTNASPAEREPVIAAARHHGARVVGYWFPPDVAGSLARNATRVGRERVPDVAVFATRARLRPPRYEEGFDEIHTVGFDGHGGFVLRPYPPGPGDGVGG